ncbi:MAG: thiamine pyrophosphate-dependent enzyme [Gammaproteobacteria bacterium]|nr:thiamine pyrophosphate-dependent enzyme [Gammaproteobacteria bacterium]
MNARMQSLSGGEAAVMALKAHGVDTLFCLPGIQNDWLFNALYDLGGIRVIHTRHEQGAGYMALGYALAGGVGVFNVVPGPGVLNAGAALATAHARGAKVFCLAGQLPARFIDKDLGILHQTNRQLDTLRSLSKWAERANSPEDVPQLVSRAFLQMHTGKPQPVALEIPMDVLQARARMAPPTAASPPPPPPAPDAAALDEAARALGRAENPMLFVGSGAQDCGGEVRQLAEALQAPVMGFRTGLGIIDGRHHLALHHNPAREYWRKTDVALAVGSNMRAAVMEWVKERRPKIIRIDIDPHSHDRFLTPDIAITARAEDALPALRAALARHNRKRPSRRREMQELKKWWARESAVLAPQRAFLKVIREELGEDGIFVDEVTQVGFASRLLYTAYRPRTYISTGYQGTLGYGFPTALGVKVACPKRAVVSVSGDGGFLFAMPELATAVQQRIALVSVVFNNNQYGNVRQMQMHDYGGRVIASDLHNPDFVRLAKSFGALGLRARGAGGLRRALRRALASELPSVIEVPVGDMPSIDRFR